MKQVRKICSPSQTHPNFSEENNKKQVNREIRDCDCCGGKHNTFCPHKKDIPPTREPFYPSEGNIQNSDDRMNMNQDGLPMSIGQAQHE